MFDKCMFISNMLDNVMQQDDIKFLDFSHGWSATEKITADKVPPYVIFLEIMLCLLNTGLAHVNPNYLTSPLGEREQVAALTASNLQYFAASFYPMVFLDIRQVVVR